MKDQIKINLSLLVIMSFFLHVIFFTAYVLPDITGLASYLAYKKKDNQLFSGIRDIIVNANQDDQREITRTTLLSDRDSTAKGFITKEAGDRWLNNSLEFKMRKGEKEVDSKGKVASSGEKSQVSDKDSEIVLRIYKRGVNVRSGSTANFNEMAIPDKNNITLKNAIFYNNSGLFSFNTAKFKNFNYFKSMKDKIASNWYPPMMANSIIGGYTPGYVRINAIPPQKVKLYFIMNRSGDIQKVELVDSNGNRSLDESCLDAIRLSKSFGAVPDDIRGEFILIPFIFGYYTN
ncbi:MAG: hypothetical protein FWH53_07275 [Leptospirales bacterium]|nr:hypothetical protein [Leptospirales bacterium]